MRTKLNYRRTFFIGMAFLSICAFWQMYDNSNVRVSRNDYFKLQSISFRYVVPESFLKKFGISSAYVTASGSNLFTIASKGLKGQEPTQSGSAGNISVPVPAMYNLSFSVSF